MFIFQLLGRPTHAPVSIEYIFMVSRFSRSVLGVIAGLMDALARVCAFVAAAVVVFVA